MPRKPRTDPSIRMSDKHAAQCAVLRMAAHALNARAANLADPDERTAMLRLANQMTSRVDRLEQRDLNNREADATWASLDIEERKVYTYMDRARLEWRELEPWERTRLTYRMCHIYVGRIVDAHLQRDRKQEGTTE